MSQTFRSRSGRGATRPDADGEVLEPRRVPDCRLDLLLDQSGTPSPPACETSTPSVKPSQGRTTRPLVEGRRCRSWAARSGPASVWFARGARAGQRRPREPPRSACGLRTGPPDGDGRTPPDRPGVCVAPAGAGVRPARLPVLVFDFAGFGDSRPGPDGQVDSDVVAATAQLRRRGVDRVVLVGSSMGGTAVLSAATRICPPVAAVVSLSGASGFGGVDAQGAMARLRCRCCSSSPPMTSRSGSRPG